MNQPKWVYAAVLLGVALSTPAWGINKCTGADGMVTYQDTPCTGKGEELNVKPANGNAPIQKPANTEKPPEAQKQPSENIPVTTRQPQPPVSQMKTQMEIEADMCLAWYKPLLRDPQGAYYTQAGKDNRVVTITIHSTNGYGGYVTKSASCEIYSGALDAGWTKKHAKRGGW
jgi:hypothetical protein